MNKKDINQFFEFLCKVIKESGYRNLSQDFVYHHLTRYGIPKEHKNFNQGKMLFNTWIERYKNNDTSNGTKNTKRRGYNKKATFQHK